jgi:hypothetical protein
MTENVTCVWHYTSSSQIILNTNYMENISYNIRITSLIILQHLRSLQETFEETDESLFELRVFVFLKRKFLFLLKEDFPLA